jgi:hypothetical protein
LKKYFIAYKPFLLFFDKVFLTFIVLTLLSRVLGSFEDNKIDSITTLVGRNTEQLLDLFPVDVATEENKEDVH